MLGAPGGAIDVHDGAGIEAVGGTGGDGGIQHTILHIGVLDEFGFAEQEAEHGGDTVSAPIGDGGTDEHVCFGDGNSDRGRLDLAGTFVDVAEASLVATVTDADGEDSALAGDLSERWENQRTKTWAEVHCSELRGQTIVVLGTGNIGSAVARMAAPFRMNVVGVRRNPQPTEHFSKVVGPDQLRDVLPEADYLVIACPLTDETEGMIGPEEFAVVKPGAYLINVSRGKVVQEPALMTALADGTLSGAFLDAHAQEPLPEDHPLWTTPGVTVIPHDSHSSPYIGDNIIDLFTDNLDRYLKGQPLRNLIDPARGY